MAKHTIQITDDLTARSSDSAVVLKSNALNLEGSLAYAGKIVILKDELDDTIRALQELKAKMKTC